MSSSQHAPGGDEAAQSAPMTDTGAHSNPFSNPGGGWKRSGGAGASKNVRSAELPAEKVPRRSSRCALLRFVVFWGLFCSPQLCPLQRPRSAPRHLRSKLLSTSVCRELQVVMVSPVLLLVCRALVLAQVSSALESPSVKFTVHSSSTVMARADSGISMTNYHVIYLIIPG